MGPARGHPNPDKSGEAHDITARKVWNFALDNWAFRPPESFPIMDA
jgi:hypothetical protein